MPLCVQQIKNCINKYFIQWYYVHCICNQSYKENAWRTPLYGAKHFEFHFMLLVPSSPAWMERPSVHTSTTFRPGDTANIDNGALQNLSITLEVTTWCEGSHGRIALAFIPAFVLEVLWIRYFLDPDPAASQPYRILIRSQMHSGAATSAWCRHHSSKP